MILGVGSAMAIGCGHPYEGTRPMTSSELAVVDATMANGDRAQSAVERLIRASSQQFFDANGDDIDAETFIAQLNERREDLARMRDTGLIRAIVGTKIVSGEDEDHEASAYRQDLLAEKNDFIALDPEFLDEDSVMCRLDYGTLLHEVAHQDFKDLGGVGGHSDEMHDANGTNDGVMVAWDQNDYSYELTYVYSIPDEIYADDASSFSSSEDYAFRQVADGTWNAGQALEYYDSRTYADQEEWAANAVDNLVLNDAPLLDFFGWNADDVKSAILETTMHDVAEEQAAEFRAVLVEKIRENREGKEANADFGTEIPSGSGRR